MAKQRMTLNKILNQWVYVIKIISFDNESPIRYYYPRFILKNQQYGEVKVQLDGVEMYLDILIAAFNHLVEILVISYDEFCSKMRRYVQEGLYRTLTLRDLLYRIFKVEYSMYIIPLLSEANNWIQVEASFDKFIFLSQDGKYGYRIDPIERIKPFRIDEIDLEIVGYTEVKSGKQFKEKIFVPFSETNITPNRLK